MREVKVIFEKVLECKMILEIKCFMDWELKKIVFNFLFMRIY